MSDAVVAATSGAVAGLATLALHGTRWNFDALYSDAGFRTEAATRFADSAALDDYGYRGLPTYYPPALPWLQGRVADIFGVPAWEVMKPVTLGFAFAVPLLAYVAWRRVLPEPWAAVMVSVLAFATADLVKPDEWLVLMVVVPWWLELVRGHLLPGRRPVAWWTHGLVLGALLLFHTFYFLPLALATVAALVLDALFGGTCRLPPVRGLKVAVVGLIVAAPSWVPLAVMKLQGTASDDLQRRWSEPGFTVPPHPSVTGFIGLLGLLGLVGFAAGGWSSRLPRSMATLLCTAYGFFVVGQLLQSHGVALLPEKTGALIRYCLVVAGVLAARGFVHTIQSRLPRPAVVLVCTIGMGAVTAAASAHYAEHWLLGDPAATALTMRYPNGGYPDGGVPDTKAPHHPWGVSLASDQPSTSQVLAAWRTLTGRPLSSDVVLLSARADIIATTPVHPFTSWKSIYSHPYGQYEDRVAFLRRVSKCPTPRCAWLRLRHNPFDAIDGAALTHTRGGLRLSLTSDRFPDGWVIDPVTFDPTLFTQPYFAELTVGDVALIRLASRDPAGVLGGHPTRPPGARGLAAAPPDSARVMWRGLCRTAPLTPPSA